MRSEGASLDNETQNPVSEYRTNYTCTYTPVIAEFWLGLGFLPFSYTLFPLSPPFKLPLDETLWSSPGWVGGD